MLCVYMYPVLMTVRSTNVNRTQPVNARVGHVIVAHQKSGITIPMYGVVHSILSVTAGHVQPRGLEVDSWEGLFHTTGTAVLKYEYSSLHVQWPRPVVSAVARAR